LRVPEQRGRRGRGERYRRVVLEGDDYLLLRPLLAGTRERSTASVALGVANHFPRHHWHRKVARVPTTGTAAPTVVAAATVAVGTTTARVNRSDPGIDEQTAVRPRASHARWVGAPAPSLVWAAPPPAVPDPGEPPPSPPPSPGKPTAIPAVQKWPAITDPSPPSATSIGSSAPNAPTRTSVPPPPDPPPPCPLRDHCCGRSHRSERVSHLRKNR